MGRRVQVPEEQRHPDVPAEIVVIRNLYPGERVPQYYLSEKTRLWTPHPEAGVLYCPPDSEPCAAILGRDPLPGDLPLRIEAALPEVAAAAAWWATFFKRRVSGARRAAFEEWIVWLYQTQVLGHAPWNPEQPDEGTELRTLTTEHGPNDILAVAARCSGVPTRWLPEKITMRIDPGQVVVTREGEGEQVFPQP